MARFFREDFDRDRSFVAARQFVFNGQSYIPGQSVPKEEFTVRRLRQLYDNRYIDYGVKPVAVVPDAVVPESLKVLAKKPPVRRLRPRVNTNDVTA